MQSLEFWGVRDSRTRVHAALAQLQYLLYELQLMVNRKKWRWLLIWFSGFPGTLISYRLDRCFYLLCGSVYPAVRILLFPLFLLLSLLGPRHEIHYRAEIGKGLRILHPSLGVVVSGHAICGEHLTLHGGNCIGIRRPLQRGELVIGDSVSFGINAVVLGPARIGNRCRIGAGAVVVRDAPDNAVLVGVPAVEKRRV